MRPPELRTVPSESVPAAPSSRDRSSWEDLAARRTSDASKRTVSLSASLVRSALSRKAEVNRRIVSFSKKQLQRWFFDDGIYRQRSSGRDFSDLRSFPRTSSASRKSTAT
jgi:hypothetical protein